MTARCGGPPRAGCRTGHRILPVAGFYPDEEIAREHDRDLSPVPHELEVYTHVEGLVGEEERLLEEIEEASKKEHHERLQAIAHELDHAWETLRRRAERRGASGTDSSTDGSEA